MKRQTCPADLPPVHRHVVGQVVAAQVGAPEGRRHHVLHESAGDHRVPFGPRRDRRLVDLLLADAGGMHVGLVREVHQVVHHQAVIALHVVQAAGIGPVRVIGPFEVMDLRRIGQARVAGPDPDETMALGHRKAADAGKALHALARHGDRLAVAAHHQPVIAAHQVSFANLAEGQLRAAVRTEVFHRGNPALDPAVEGDLLAADLAAERPGVDFIGRAGDVPGILGEHDRARLKEAVGVADFGFTVYRNQLRFDSGVYCLG
jgi:hypothetical protein